jgi:hypothetical protein
VIAFAVEFAQFRFEIRASAFEDLLQVRSAPGPSRQITIGKVSALEDGANELAKNVLDAGWSMPRRCLR